MKTAIATIKRPNGKIETAELPQPHPSMMANGNHFGKMFNATKNAGRGEIQKIIVTEIKYGGSNLHQLQAEYNKAINEGGEGYVPGFEYFEKLGKIVITEDETITTKFTK